MSGSGRESHSLRFIDFASSSNFALRGLESRREPGIELQKRVGREVGSE